MQCFLGIDITHDPSAAPLGLFRHHNNLFRLHYEGIFAYIHFRGPCGGHNYYLYVRLSSSLMNYNVSLAVVGSNGCVCSQNL